LLAVPSVETNHPRHQDPTEYQCANLKRSFYEPLEDTIHRHSPLVNACHSVANGCVIADAFPGTDSNSLLRLKRLMKNSDRL
jgi:hypothetical protein